MLAYVAYAGFWLGVGVFFATAELQHYDGAHPWEPFLWELSSSIVSGALVLGVYRWHVWLLGRRWSLRIAGHLAGAAAYVVAHSALMYAVRFAVYAVIDVTYRPGTALSVLAYEAAKDVVSYTIVIGMSHAYWVSRRQRELETELEAARLARLQAQIQPHFLFNTLNLASSVMYEDVERADQILSELAELLRGSLSAGQAPIHTLEQELTVLAPFLAITEKRFGARLSVRVEVTPAAAECLVPTLLLIATVENAITHGVAQTTGEVEVVVAARVDGDELVIEVSDSAGKLGETAPGTGVGLANTRARLAVLHGARASVTLALREGRTVLTMRMPA
jgi:two-component system, LytTR family, sensor kinase